MSAKPGPPTDVSSVLSRVQRPKRAVVTSGMPYANGPLHLGHLAGAQLPADIHARWLSLMIGREQVMFVCGTDDHGSTSELSALGAGTTAAEFVGRIHAAQASTLERYGIDLDVYSGTSQPDCLPRHTELCQEFVRRLHANGLLVKRTSKQWYDPSAERFLPDRLVRGRCPNPKCDNQEAYSDECARCGRQHEPQELIDPRSTISDARPQMRDTAHLWLDMWAVSDVLQQWIEGKRKSWRAVVVSQVLETVMPAIEFAREHEPRYKELADKLASHKRKYTAGQQVALRFSAKPDMEAARAVLAEHGISTQLVDGWAHRPITRDIEWGIPLPPVEQGLEGKTLYVWPDSLIAPLAFTQLALERAGRDPEEYAQYWRDPEAQVYQFLGQDNVFFYVLMQGAMWLGTQSDPHRLPEAGELQLTEVLGAFHLRVSGAKMSKSTGNFVTADQLLDEHGYDPDQVRYYLALLGLADKASDFDFAKLDERNSFLSGPMNAVFERPISAAHSKFGGRVPAGKLVDKVEAETVRMVQRYVRAMEKAVYPSMLFELENYARTINSLFTKYKPHDDRHPEESRADALYSSFYVLKSLMIMLSPFVPATMNRLRESLRLPAAVLSLDQLGTPMEAGHELGDKQAYFPSTAVATEDS